MAADRVDEGDKRDTTDALSGPAQASPEMPADQERLAAIRRIHRILVGHTYGVARDAWADAVPHLRSVWEKHKERYPERSRAEARTTSDGAWEAGEQRLSPEQNAEATKAHADMAEEGHRDILPALKRVEATDPNRRLAGLDHMIKGEDRLKEKIADELTAKPGRTVQQVLDTVVDPVRFTFTYQPQRYADGVHTDVELLKAEGFELVKLKNLWAADQYKGVNSQWRRAETGLRFEVQFHTLESLEAKELTHAAYARIRSSAGPAERKELAGFQRLANALLVTPEHTAEIKDFPEKNNG